MKLFIIILLSILFSCKNKTSIENIKTKQVLRIDTLAVISFRRSYVDHQDLTKKELNKLYKSNPILEEYDGYKKYVPLFKELEKLKILEEKDLILKRFENIYSKEVKYLDAEKQISFNYSSDFTKSNSINIKIVKNKAFIEKKIDFPTSAEMMCGFCVLAFCAAPNGADADTSAEMRRREMCVGCTANYNKLCARHIYPSSAEMMRGFCVFAFCAANYKRGLCNAQIPLRTYLGCISAQVTLAFCAANYKRGLCNAQIPCPLC